MSTRLVSTLVAVGLLLGVQPEIGAHSSISAAAVSSGFKHLGTFPSQSCQMRESDYFLSQNAAGWSTADKDCKRIFGEDASLVYIETREELDSLNQFFQGDDTGTLFWAGGRYDTRENSFIWHNSILFEGWAPWEAGFPNTRFSTTRVAVIREPGMELQFQTHLQTVSLRYICEYLKL